MGGGGGGPGDNLTKHVQNPHKCMSNNSGICVFSETNPVGRTLAAKSLQSATPASLYNCLHFSERMCFRLLGHMVSMDSMDFSGPKVLNETRSGSPPGSSPWSPWQFPVAILQGAHGMSLGK